MKTSFKTYSLRGFAFGFMSACGIFAIFGWAYLGHASSTGKNEKSAAEYSAAVQAAGNTNPGVYMSWNEFTAAKADFAAGNPDATLGGSISKDKLQNMLNSVPMGTSTVSFYFGNDPAAGRNFVMFLPSGTSENSPNAVIIRNTAYCPVNCD